MGKKNNRLDGVRFNLLPNSVGQTADGFEVERHPEDEKRPYNYDPNGFLRGNNAVLVPSAVVQQQARPGVKSQAIRRHVVDTTEEWDMDGLDDAALERDFPTRKPKRMTRRREEELKKQEEIMRRYQATQDGEKDDEMFDHAEEADFDVDFIQQMIYGEVGEEDEEDKRLAGLDEFGMPKKKKTKSILKKSGDAEDDDEEGDEEDEEWEEDEEDYDWDDEEWDEEGEDEVAAAEKYNVHAPDGRAIDRQYQRMLREFEVDAKINKFTEREEDLDPRTRGPLEIKQYVPLLQEFAEDNAGFSHLSDDPLKHKGLINQLRGMTRENRVFDTDKDGEYVISILPDKATRKRQEFRRDAEDNKDVTLQFIHQQEEARQRGLRADEDVQASHAVLDHHGNKREVREEDLPKRMQQRYDVETILTTASTAFNHPNVIAAGAKKKLNMREAMRRAREGGFAAQKAAEAAPAPAASSAALPGTLTVHSSTTHADPNMGVYGASNGAQVAEEASVEESEDEDDMDVITIDPTQRPKDESKEEKRIRKEIVKQMQREKRMQKKVLGSAYKSAEGDHAKKAGRVKQDKALISLSLARN